MHWELRTRRLLAQGLFWMLVLLAILAIRALGGEPRKSRVERIPDPAYSPKRGDYAMLYSYNPEKDASFPVTAAKTSWDYRDYWRALDIDDQAGADEVEIRGGMVKVPPKTSVLVLEIQEFDVKDPRPDAAVVRIVDGPLRGQKFLVPIFRACQLIENPNYAPPKVAEAAKPDPTRRKTIEEMTPDEIRDVRAGAARQMADSYLNIAENLRKSGKYVQARKAYQEVIRDFSSHPEARKARERLKTLPAK